MEDMSQTTLVGHIQKEQRNCPPNGTIPQQRLGQLWAKPSCSNLHIQSWGPKKMCSFYFPKVRRLFWSVKNVKVDHISVLTWHKEPGDQTVQDKMFWRHWVTCKEIPTTFKGNFNLTSPAHLCRSNSTHLSEAKLGLHIYWQRLAFSLMVSWIQGNYGRLMKII